MSKLTKAEVKTHDKACELLALSRDLTYDERLYVLDNWQESAQHVNSRSGAFFTPSSLAHDLSIYTPDGGTLLDLCAGIGTLAFHCIDRTSNTSSHTRLTCVEVNPDYVEVGRRIVPEAEWVCADVFDLPDDIRRTDWDCVVCNPPFGRSKDVPVQGVTYDLNVLAIAIRLSQYGVFILPQMSCPFAYSGHQNYQERPSRDFDRFKAKVGDVRLQCSSIDCSMYRDDWKGVSPGVEIVYYDLLDQRLHDAQNSGRYKDLVRRIEAYREQVRSKSSADDDRSLAEIWANLERIEQESNIAWSSLRAVMADILNPTSVTLTTPTSILTDAEVSQYVQEIEDLRTQGDDETADAMEEWLGQTLGFEGSEDTETEDVAPPTESPIHPLHTSSPVIDTAALAALFEE